MLSISIGLAILLWLQCLLAGRNENMIQKITSTYTGHLQIAQTDYRKTHLPTKTMVSPPEIQIGVAGSSTKRVHLPALISTGEESVPVMLEGIEPENEATITKLKQNLKEGEYLSSGADSNCDLKEAYVGRTLLQLLNGEIGGKLVVLAQANDGTLGNELLRVKGVFDSGSPDFDKSYVFSQIGCVQKIGALNGIHEIVIKLDKSDDESVAVAKISSEIPPTATLTSWREAIPTVATMIRYNDASFKMIVMILFTVIVLGVVNTLLMNIFERTREFGVMLALGTTPAQLRILILFESLFIGLIASAAGLIMGVAIVAYHMKFGFDLSPFFGNRTGTDVFSFDLIVYPILQFAPLLRLAAIILVFIVLAGVFPAYRASKLNPIDVMRS